MNDPISITRQGNCGDYSILENFDVRAIFEKHCGIYTDEGLELMRNLVNSLDPVREARAAAQKADFRLAAIVDGGPPRPDQTYQWSIEGVHCEKIGDKDVFIWVQLSDALTGPLASFQGSMRRFAIAYNFALLAELNFPKDRACTTTIRLN